MAEPGASGASGVDGKAAPARSREPVAPPGTRLYVVGDVHGCRALLEELHALIRDDAAASAARRKVIVYLGDYIDRGSDSKGVVDLLISRPLPGFESIHLKGNHEQALLDFLDDIEIGPDWFSFGGVQTFDSYGLRAPAHLFDIDGLLAAQAALKAELPPEHLAFYESLRLVHLEGDFLMVHAGLRPGIDFEAQTENDLLWIREPFLDSEERFGPIVVHGHTIAMAPEIRPNRIGIDTGAFYTGRLTCLVLQDATLGFLQTPARPMAGWDRW
jgi:serine/threonine protein phosphatase 1